MILNVGHKSIIIRNPIKVFTRREARTCGYLNRTKDNYFVPVLDYDCIDLAFLEMDLDVLGKEFHLSDWLIWHSKDADEYHGWHAVTLDKLTFSEFRQLLGRSSCDRDYKNAPFWTPSRSATLRMIEKGDRREVIYYGYLPSDIHEREKSNAHAEFFEKLGANIRRFGTFDKYSLEDVILEAYNTGHNIQVKKI
jgi:hypothetical protein